MLVGILLVLGLGFGYVLLGYLDWRDEVKGYGKNHGNNKGKSKDRRK